MILFAGGGPPTQPGIDYQHKRLFREIERELSITDPVLDELALTGMPGPVLGKFFRVTANSDSGPAEYIYIGRINSCRAGGCSISPVDEVWGDSEYFDYFIFFDSTLNVSLVRVFNYQATHGQEVSARGWLKQFEGYDGKKDLHVGQEVDAIAGATISVHGITDDVVEKTRLLQSMVGGNPKKIAGSVETSDL